MLPPFIIEQIRRREEREAEERRRGEQRPRVEIPMDIRRPASEPPPEDDDQSDRGVIILDLG